MRGVDDEDDADEEADGVLALGVAMIVAMVSRECIGRLLVTVGIDT